MTAQPKTLLTTSRHVAWEKINADKRALLAGDGAEPVEDRLRRGQRLSAQAARLRRAIVSREPDGSRS
ncbi:MAG: hypothetical protein H0T43_07365 [Solirubrobacterales bacterium]|nr:hypothetical protein [Solirubrobacterales bacterium]